jgi:uncharacterized DUF497 family protein
LTSAWSPRYDRLLKFEFDPAKDASNIAKHGVSLAEAAAIE